MDPGNDKPNFDGKTVFVSGAHGKAIGALVSPRFEQQHGRTFLVGETETRSDNWSAGSTIAVAWDAVCSYIILDTEVWNRRRAEREPAAKSPWKFWKSR